MADRINFFFYLQSIDGIMKEHIRNTYISIPEQEVKPSKVQIKES